ATEVHRAEVDARAGRDTGLVRLADHARRHAVRGRHHPVLCDQRAGAQAVADLDHDNGWKLTGSGLRAADDRWLRRACEGSRCSKQNSKGQASHRSNLRDLKPKHDGPMLTEGGNHLGSGHHRNRVVPDFTASRRDPDEMRPTACLIAAVAVAIIMFVCIANAMGGVNWIAVVAALGTGVVVYVSERHYAAVHERFQRSLHPLEQLVDLIVTLAMRKGALRVAIVAAPGRSGIYYDGRRDTFLPPQLGPALARTIAARAKLADGVRDGAFRAYG